ncbi:MAG: restriction endonuclease subunit S [Pseudomonadota bacterium]
MMQSTAIPSGWRQRRLRFDIKSNPKKAELDLDDETEISFVSMDAVGELGGLRLDTTRALADVYKDYTYFADGDVCIARITPCFENGKGALATGLTEGVGFGTTELHVLRPKEDLDRKFLFYITISHDFRGYGEAEMLGAGGQKRVPERFIKDWRAPLPDLYTQRRIAGYLDDKTSRIDALIEKKRALLDRLAEKCQALITRAVTRGLNPDAPLKDSGIDWLGKVPAHWTTANIRRFAKMRTGHTPSRSVDAYWDDCTIPWFTLADIWQLRDGRQWYLGETSEQISELGLANSAAELLPKGTVVLSRTASVGFSGIMPEPMATSQDFWNWICWDALRPEYLLLLFRSMKQEFERTMAGSTHQTIYKDVAAGLQICVPPLDEQDAIVAQLLPQVDAHYSAAANIAASIEKLTEYRAALVTAAVTGKIKALLTEDAPKPAKKEAPAAFKRSVLAAYIADTLCDHPTFGRVKFQKLLHLCEAHLEIQEVAGNYHRDAAGPFDTQMMRSVHSQIEKQGWISPVKGDKGWTYARGEKVDGYRDHFNRYFGSRKEALEDLLALIAPMKTQQAEIVSTAFAAWNDLLLEGKSPSDNEIVDLILNDWTESKKKISADRWHSALVWMRDKDLTPRGLGEHTKSKEA